MTWLGLYDFYEEDDVIHIAGYTRWTTELFNKSDNANDKKSRDFHGRKNK